MSRAFRWEANPWSAIKADPRIAYQVEGVVNEEELDDRIYYFEREEGDVFRAVPQRRIKVRLTGGGGVRDHEGIPDGVFDGRFWHVDYDPTSSDYFLLDAKIPVEQMLELQRLLKECPGLKIALGVNLLCFTYEVDDALREAHHSRALVIEEMTAAPVSGMMLTHCKPLDLLAVTPPVVDGDDGDDDDDDDDDDDEGADERTESPVTLATLLQAVSVSMSMSAQATKKMTVALWVLIVLAGLNLLS